MDDGGKIALGVVAGVGIVFLALIGIAAYGVYKVGEGIQNITERAA